MNKNLKIAIIGSRGYPYVYSGYETLVKELSERLVKKGHKVRVYCHSSLFKKKPRHINGIELIYTPSIETKFLSQIINSFFSFIHVCFSNVDIILVVNTANGPFGIFTRLFNKKTCVNVDGLEWLRPKWKGLGSLYFKFSSKLSTILFDLIVTDSKEMSKVYSNNFNKNSSVIAYGPTIVKTKNLKILKKYNLKLHEYYLIVGRLIPDNNSLLILKGFLKSESKKKLVIVGDVPYKDSYVETLKSHSSSNVIFTGYVRDQEYLSCLYKNCYAYIHGHEYGGTNPTMVNALYLNSQILALKTVFNVEMLNNKKAVFFRKNIMSVSNGIKYFEKNYNKLIKKNKNFKISDIYNWDLITEKYLKIFFKITSYRNK